MDTYPNHGNTIPSTVSVGGVWTGGGAATDCTHAAADWSRGIVSVKYNGATGKYQITFLDVPGSQVVGFSADIARATGTTNALIAKMVAGSYSTSTKTLNFEVCDLSTPVATDLTTGDKIMFHITFAKSPPP